MATTKFTQRDYFNAAIKFFNGEDIDFTNEEMVEFFESRIAVLDKKSANRKTKVNEEDEALKAAIMEVLSSGDRMTVSAIMARDDIFTGLSNQKVSALLRKLIADGVVDKEKDKKSTVFFKVAQSKGESLIYPG